MKQETTKEMIIRKLTSRKLWAAVCSFVVLIMTARGFTDAQAAQASAIIMAGAVVLGYILAEGLTDKAGAGAEKEPEEKPEKDYTTSAIGFMADMDDDGK